MNLVAGLFVASFQVIPQLSVKRILDLEAPTARSLAATWLAQLAVHLVRYRIGAPSAF